MTLKVILRNGAASWLHQNSNNGQEALKDFNKSLAVLSVVVIISINISGAQSKTAHLPPGGLGRATSLVLSSDL